MDSSADPANDLAPRSAGEWLIALRERPHDRQLRLRLQAWLAASAEHSRDWEEMNATWSALGAVAPQASALPRRSVSRSRGRRALMAAAIVLGLAVAIGRGPDLLLDLRADLATGTAEVRTVKLEDGTQVSLGPQTAVDIAFSGGERRVLLLRGEAFFAVAANDRRPFVVETGTVEARDIGTAFNVRLGSGVTEVSVQDGLVDVRTKPPGQPADRLQAGDSLRILANGAHERQMLEPAQIAPWRNRQLIVDNQPVAAVVDAIRPYYSGMIVVRGARFSGEPLTGVYNLADPASALRAVAAAHGATVHRLSPWVTVLNGD